MEITLPNYSDDEISVFHPIFQFCAEEAIKHLNMMDELRVVHHRGFNGITVDYSIERKHGNKIILLVEIKRTVSAVGSTRYRHQALSYRKEADHLCETRYYMLTNLEQTDLFRYDANKPRVSSQIIKGSPFTAGNFKNTNPNSFPNNLIDQIKTILNIAINDTGEYDESLEILHNLLSTKTDNYADWHELLMPFSYEYIRGSAHNYANLLKKIENVRWKAAGAYINQPHSLSNKGKLIGFGHVFKEPYPEPNDLSAFDQPLLENAFRNGKARGKADDVSEIVYDLLIPKYPAIVETDEELARLLAVLARYKLGRSLKLTEKIVDPAAGSGRLLTAAVNTCFTEALPNNLWANEIECRFSEALSLRLGLCFAENISPENSPKITLLNLADLSAEDFSHAKVILLNPPYLSGIRSKNQKTKISEAIRNLTKKPSATNTGQIGLEGPFLELVSALAPNESVIAAIMPFSLLTRKSNEIVNFRKYLLESFGLAMIATYPRAGLFEDVVKKTCILVGKKGSTSNHIQWLNINVPIERVDVLRLISTKSNPNNGTYSLTSYSYDELNENLLHGWFGETRKISKERILKLLGNECLDITHYISQIKRGTSGNSGSSDLSAIRKSKKKLVEMVPLSLRVSSINSSSGMEKFLDDQNSPCISPIIDQSESTKEQSYIYDLIEAYLQDKKLKIDSAKQPRDELTHKKVFRSLKKDINVFPPYSILLPRGTRVYGSVGICLTPYNISTNFIVLSCSNKKQAVTLASWLYSIFGQLQMEFLSNDQEGMRKLEKREVVQILAPKIMKNLSSPDYERIESAFKVSEPMNFKRVQLRKIDKVWAEIISGDSNKALEDTFDLLSDLVGERDPISSRPLRSK